MVRDGGVEDAVLGATQHAVVLTRVEARVAEDLDRRDGAGGGVERPRAVGQLAHRDGAGAASSRAIHRPPNHICPVEIATRLRRGNWENQGL